jgi:DNA topoisomerase-1
MNLIIVESPTKANTLNKFLGDGYTVIASKGHIKDLPKSRLGIDIEKGFSPSYEVVAKKAEVIKEILASAKKANIIYLATDPDREGEAISAHINEILKKKNTKRIVFHEITKEAVEEAIKNPGKVDENLVDAQIARRVLDRLVGYKLSPLLWKKVRRGLSAGRVQTVAVRLIVEKEREIEAFKSEEYWDIFCLVKKDEEFSIQLIKEKITNQTDADKIVKDLEKANYSVLSVDKKEVRKAPFPPFTTSTLTQAMARNFGWSAKKTMSGAQKLYEEGFITYHRTDSTNVSLTAVEKLREYIRDNYGQDYLSLGLRLYRTKSKVAQEAHEAIRPTSVAVTSSTEEMTLYGVIWKRFVATQMAESIFDLTMIDVQAGFHILRASGQIMKFDGWNKLYSRSKDETILPEVKPGDELQLIKVDPQQKFTLAPARYGEAGLIKTLEKLGIGRPSTYAPIISTIQIRNYVEKKEGRFFPTSIGIAVNDFLIKYFPDVFEYSFTAKMEDDLDNIANGVNKWVPVIKTFWDPFSKKLDSVTEKSKRVKIATEKLGIKCPDCKDGELVIRIGRFGKFVSCSNFPECKHTEKYLEKTGAKCPECKIGDVIVKKSKKYRKFFGCSRYPECKWASWEKPVVDRSIAN